ncbi:MAG: ABC transporter substrate-binding protein [Pseudomonadota bacterium]
MPFPAAGAIARRRFIQLCGAGASAVAAPAWSQSRSIRIGSTFDGSSIEKDTGMDCFKGAQACFAGLNRAGGIGGAKVELVRADDQYKPELSKSNALAFQADGSMLGMISPLGTRTTASIMETVKDMAVVGPFTGTASLRKASPPNIFWVRASYDAEIDKLIRTAVTLGQDRIALMHPRDAFGAAVLEAFQRTMAEVKLQPAAIATIPNVSSTEVEPAAQALAKAQPQVVIMAVGGVAPLFLKALRAAGGLSTVYGLSVAASSSNLAAMGPLARGLGFSTLVPSPFAIKHELVRRYQADMIASGSKDYSLPSLEGYVNACVMAEGLRLAGNGVNRKSLIAALDSITNLDLGGLVVRYGKGSRAGSSFVDVAVVGAGGKMLS